MRTLIPFIAAAWFVMPQPAGAQSRCADCHFANMDASFAEHISDWERSAHGRAAVGCESCHGGDAGTFESVLAHRNILPPSHRASPVNRINLPATCGKCHAGPFAVFQESRHFALLRAGDPNPPTCSTCHGEVAADLLSPKGLEGQCARCHGADRTYQRTEYPAQARLMLQNIRDVRAQLKEAESLIRRVKDPARRAELTAAADQVRVPLTEAAHAGHAFRFEGLQERVDTARVRVTALLERLANR